MASPEHTAALQQAGQCLFYYTEPKELTQAAEKTSAGGLRIMYRVLLERGPQME